MYAITAPNAQAGPIIKPNALLVIANVIDITLNIIATEKVIDTASNKLVSFFLYFCMTISFHKIVVWLSPLYQPPYSLTDRLGSVWVLIDRAKLCPISDIKKST